MMTYSRIQVCTSNQNNIKNFPDYRSSEWKKRSIAFVGCSWSGSFWLFVVRKRWINISHQYEPFHDISFLNVQTIPNG